MHKQYTFSRYYFTLLCLLGSILLKAQTVRFEALLQMNEVVLGSRFQVSFLLENAEAINFEAPSFKGFKKSGPSTSNSISIVNGKRSSNQTFTYVLTPTKTGTFTIPSAKVTLKSGKTLLTKKLKVKVLKGNAKLNNQLSKLGDNVYIKTIVHNPQPVVGEQVLIDVKLFTKIRIQNFDLVNLPDFDKMRSETIQNFNNSTQEENINGERYLTKVIHRMVVFPNKKGELVIPPAAAEVAIETSGTGSAYNPFYNVETYPLVSAAQTIEVKTYPKSPPNDFDGLVGQYRLLAHVEKNTITSDDVIKLIVRIEGRGDLKKISAPKLNLNQQQLEVFQPNIEEDIRQGADGIGGVRLFEYLISPRAIGQFTISPSLTFYNPQLQKYTTQDSSITVNIIQGTNPLPQQGSLTAEQAIDSSSQEADLSYLPLQDKTELIASQPTVFLGSLFFYLCLCLPIISLAFVHQRAKQQEKLSNIDPKIKKAQDAGSVASKELKEAKQLLDKDDSKAFYLEINKALFNYIEDKFALEKATLSKKNIAKELENRSASQQSISQLLETIELCEMALFAGFNNKSNMSKVYTQSLSFIENIEKQNLVKP